jgi:hypothetical protein
MSQESPFRFDEEESLKLFADFLDNIPNDKYIEEFREYLLSTYNAHYNQRPDGRQTIEDILDLGFMKGFCGASIFKYLDRFGNKEGFNEVDILKIMHYCVFLLHAHRNGKL